MFDAPTDPHLVPFSGDYSIAAAATAPPAHGIDDLREALDEQVERIAELQRVLYAHNRYSVLLVFQAMDAAGKDSTIRKVLSGVNPAGCQVVSFKRPSATELDHDFLWRTARRLPERGRIGVFNRSHYEEVLVVRVHPGILEKQRLPGPIEHGTIWQQRFESIRDHEKHLARNGTVILKFWLNVSREEQTRRFIARLETPRKRWKFSADDVREAGHWDAYMRAYEEVLNATSVPWAPWYAIPADDKPYMRYSVARIVADTLAGLDANYPPPDELDEAEVRECLKSLKNSG